MRMFFQRHLPLFAPPGEGDGGGQQQQQQQQQQQPAAFDQNAVYTKYAVPDGMKGANWEEGFGKLHEGYKGLRDKVAGFAPPKTPADYKFEPGEKIKGFFKTGDDPGMTLAREVAHKLGVPDPMFGGLINGVFEAMADKGLLPQPYSPAKEIDAIAKMVAPDKAGAERDNAVKAAITEAEAFAPVFAKSLNMSEGAGKLLSSLAQEAGGVEVLRALKAANPQIKVEIGGTQQQQGYTKADYDKDVADPRYSPFGPKYDKAWREGIDAKAREIFK